MGNETKVFIWKMCGWNWPWNRIWTILIIVIWFKSFHGPVDDMHFICWLFAFLLRISYNECVKLNFSRLSRVIDYIEYIFNSKCLSTNKNITLHKMKDGLSWCHSHVKLSTFRLLFNVPLQSNKLSMLQTNSAVFFIALHCGLHCFEGLFQ